ncbi:MAG: antibiotic biosynthesis monooxygenase [Chloroflexi bacterium]|nr:antibiotic biosynthesis monooxygenase [Chloroflexota bacterium]
MITVIVNHWVLPERMKEAEATIKENGRAMRSYAGFISRQTLYAQKDPHQITTVTNWQNQESYQGWTGRPNPPQPRPNAPVMWSKPVESTVFEVTPEL